MLWVFSLDSSLVYPSCCTDHLQPTFDQKTSTWTSTLVSQEVHTCRYSPVYYRLVPCVVCLNVNNKSLLKYWTHPSILTIRFFIRLIFILKGNHFLVHAMYAKFLSVPVLKL